MPSNRKFLTTYDGAGRPNSVGTSAGSYVSSVTYAPQGAPSQVVFGNGVTETRNYNARLQPMQIAAGTSSTNLLNLQYGYSPTQNNGNVMSQTITRPVGSWTQMYGYDLVNRLTSASESGTGSWSENFGFDAVGNRWVSSYSGLTTITSETPQSSSWFGSNNRIVQSGWNYDQRGNLSAIGGMPRTFSYDGENRLKTAVVNGVTTNYAYDADGKRVQKVASSITTTYVYDAFGELAAEHTTGLASDGGP